ncbi:hypothetical protein K1719_025532 [Acacia pycnantha]|nr:hypothetical protein K1719_025532 [Acacia pycnantha]
MDLSGAQPGLSLGLNGQISSPALAGYVDDNLASFRQNSSFGSSSSTTPFVPLQLLEEKDDKVRVKSSEETEEEEEEEEGAVEDEAIDFMGRPVCAKRRLEGHPNFSSNPPKRLAVNWGLDARRASVQAFANEPMEVADPEIHEIIGKEKRRQFSGIELIASENFVCRAVMEALGSHLTNKYSEGMPGAKYYTGNQFIDQMELLCCDRMMGLDLLSGGHLSHGYYTHSGKKISAASIFFETLPYKVNPLTGYLDYDKLEEKACDYRPKLLICGGSSYPREWDYARFRKIADKCGAVLMCDMAHISGLVAAKEVASPFDYCDIVTSTTHKSLRGPRGGIIFYRKGSKPRKQGLALNHGDDALKQVATPEYKVYMQQVRKNAQALASALLKRKCRLVTDGTDNHLLLWDLTALGLLDRNYEKVCEACNITLNKCAIYGSISPGGVRIGTPAMTTRGCLEDDFEIIADFLLKAAQITSNIQKEYGKSCKDFLKGLQNNKDIVELRDQVEAFASELPMPAFDI